MEQYKTDESTIDCMLQEAYGRETVPESVNIRLQNRLKCKEVMKETSISVWWLPACALASQGCALTGDRTHRHSLHKWFGFRYPKV